MMPMRTVLTSSARAAAVAAIAGCIAVATMSRGGTPDEVRPYRDDSPWNLTIGPNPEYDPSSTRMVSGLRGTFGCDPDQYTYPVYIVDRVSPRRVVIDGAYSDVSGEDILDVRKRTTVSVPLPVGAAPARGRDAQVILWNPATGDEWGFWKLARGHDGSWTARNGYHYNTRWSGVPPPGFISRGAGVPYLAGLVRPWELARGRVEHALALAVNNAAPVWVHPATKSDGQDSGLSALPEGARVQLDPTLTRVDFVRWGLDYAGVVLAEAMQRYGMIVIDGGGHPKIMLEYEATARWRGSVNEHTIRRIPYTSLRVLSLLAPRCPDAPAAVRLESAADTGDVLIRWQGSRGASGYRVLRRDDDRHEFVTVAYELSRTEYRDRPPRLPATYAVEAANHNGASRSVSVTVPTATP